MGLHALGCDMEPASKARRHRRYRSRRARLFPRAFRRREYRYCRWTRRQRQYWCQMGFHTLGRSMEPTGPKLVGTGFLSPCERLLEQGLSVALSTDGNSAIIGGPYDDGAIGAAWIFTRSGGVWSQQAKLVGTDSVGPARQGWSVSLSSDGNTAIVGGWGDSPNHALGGIAGTGAAWVFTRSGGEWSQQGPKLVGTGVVGSDNPAQGESVSLSANGNTAIIGGTGDNNGIGATWVFTRSDGVWSQQGSIQASWYRRYRRPIPRHFCLTFRRREYCYCRWAL